ncbi:hypothetical protein ACFQZ2_22615 [Streptomonospora algeriensis]|uniref:Integral membrane protein n=1 Tax=Streptomonospora algeriensis TaxID=995084 RepID=A0ABW3BNC9_9ACTN
MPTTPVPTAVRTAQALFLGFLALVVVRGLVSIAMLLPGSGDRPGYVIGYHGAGPVLALAVVGTAALLIRRPGTFRFVFALVGALGMCLAGLSNLADAPPLGLLYGALGAAALGFVLVSRHFLLGGGGGAAHQAGPYAGPQPYPGQPYAQQPYPQQHPQHWQPAPAPKQHPQQPPYGGPAGH